MATINGFSALGDGSAKILILGSMPSIASIHGQQYYAHRRNAFWPIIAELFNEGAIVNYQQGQQILVEQKIALWDVLRSCTRRGSLDSAIDTKSVVCNDFVHFFKKHKHIHKIYFNGATAEKLYKAHVWHTLEIPFQTLNYVKLPSTSPAFAAMSYNAKLAAWSAIKG